MMPGVRENRTPGIRIWLRNIAEGIADMAQTEWVLVVDVGGTRTRLALARLVESQVTLMHECIVNSREFATFEKVLDYYRVQSGEHWSRMAVGVAGPVMDQHVRVTNLPWQLDAQYLEAQGYGSCHLFNDLEAVAWGLPALADDERVCLREGEPVPGNRAVIAAGTGLGEAGIYADERGWHPFSTEGGHATFAPRDEREVALWRELSVRYGVVSWERVVSGTALPELYRFLCRYRQAETPAWLKEGLQHPEPAACLTEAALSGRDVVCIELLSWFASLYGAEAGNLALKLMSRGGVYLAGGIAPKILPFLRSKEFMSAFLDKGRMRPLLERMPVWVVMTDRVALYGLALALHQAANC